MAFVRLLSHLMRDKNLGRYIVPIVPDEARTFGMEALFRQFGIYSHVGQLYEPVDSDTVLYYREARNGQILEEGITEAGSMSSFIAAASSHSSHGISMIPFFIYYSMFGFQRIGDLLWAAGDMRSRGFVLGGTAGRTTLAGEGLQHQDGNSHLYALAFPNCQAYDPAYAYEMAVIVLDGLRRMYFEEEDIFYYITLMNENYAMPILPMGSTEGITRGIYRLSSRDLGLKKPRVQLFGSGAILRESLRAQELLEKHFGVGSNVYSVTSYKSLYYDGRDCDRWNRLHPADPPRRAYVSQALEGETGPVVAALDYVSAVGLSIAPWVVSGEGPGVRDEGRRAGGEGRAAGGEGRGKTHVSPLPLGGGSRNVSPPPWGEGQGVRAFAVLGADGFGRSEARGELRRFFEIDAENIALAALAELARQGKYPTEKLAAAIKTLGLDAQKPNPVTV
jgi:pyruvate dehydrogenase E1 component